MCVSRRLWKRVTKSLKDGNIDEATEHKHRLEERQRGEEKQRAADNKAWTPKYFSKEVQKAVAKILSGVRCITAEVRLKLVVRVDGEDQTSLSG